MSTGKLVLGTLAGLAVGAVVGILFAPEKGSVIRKQIMDKGCGCVDKIKSKFENTKDDAEEIVKNGKSKYEDLKSETNDVVSY